MVDWLEGYTLRKTITIDYTKVQASLSNFPVLVSIDGDTDIGASALSTGYDIRFTSVDGTTTLSYEREQFSITGGACTATFWVKIPTLSNTADTVIYIYYGDSDATDGQNATGVWDDGGNNNYKLVWHLGNGTTLSVSDSTTYASDGTNNNATAALGIISGAAETGSQKAIALPSAAAHVYSNATVSVWVKANTLTPPNTTTTITSDWSGSNRNYLLYQSNASLILLVGDGGGNQDNGVTVSNALSTTEWVYVTAVISGTTHILYINGTPTSETGSYSGGLTSNTRYLGADQGMSNPYEFDGKCDEFRISNVARSEDWIVTEYNNQSTPSSFYDFGTEESSSTPTNYLVIQYDEETEMFQIVGTSKTHPVTVYNTSTGAPATELVGPTVYYSVSGAARKTWSTNPPTFTYDQYMERFTFELPATVGTDTFAAYDSVEIAVVDTNGTGHAMINFRPSPTDFATAASITALNNLSSGDVTTACGSAITSAGIPAASATSVWGAVSRTLTELPAGVALTSDITALNDLDSTAVQAAVAAAINADDVLRILDIIMSGTFAITAGEGGAFTCTYTGRSPDTSTIVFAVDADGQRTSTTVNLV